MVDDDFDRCPDCGSIIFDLHIHRSVCEKKTPFDGGCPMCGERYSSYLAHLKECPANR